MIIHGLGVKKVKLAIDYNSEEKTLKRTVTITCEVSSEEAAQVDHLTKLNATFIADLHAEAFQPGLMSQTPEEEIEAEEGQTVTFEELPAVLGGDGNQPTEALPSSPKTRKKREKVTP